LRIADFTLSSGGPSAHGLVPWGRPGSTVPQIRAAEQWIPACAGMA
jgi:hypothetical protein